MKELVDNSNLLVEGQPGHKWFLQGSNFGRSLWREKIPRRSGKHQLQRRACVTGPVDEADLNLRMRIHPSHELERKGTWIECQQCHKHCKVIDGRVQQWVHQHCLKVKGQTKLKLGPGSSDS